MTADFDSTKRIQYLIEIIQQRFKELIGFDDKLLKSNLSFNVLMGYIKSINDNYNPIGIKDDKGNDLFLNDEVYVCDKNLKYLGNYFVTWSTVELGFVLSTQLHTDHYLKFDTFKTYSIKKVNYNEPSTIKN